MPQGVWLVRPLDLASSYWPPGHGYPRSRQAFPRGLALALALTLFLMLSVRPSLAVCAIWINATVLDFSSVWRYHPNTNDPGVAVTSNWIRPDFDDSAWSSGPGLFGFETSSNLYAPYAPFQTFIAPSSLGPVSTYFRAHFQWPAPATGVSLNLTNLVDDGIIVYLNGVELYSFNMPDGPRPATWNESAMIAPIEPAVFSTNVFAYLNQGDNVLAVELHQTSPGSSDNVFGMKMTTPVGHIDNFHFQPTNQVVMAGTPVTVRVDEEPAGATFQWYENGISIPGATNATYTFIETNPCPVLFPRRFFCNVESSRTCSYVSRVAEIQIVHDDEPLTVERVRGSESFTRVFVEFNRIVALPSAIDPFSYEIRDGSGHEFEIAGANRLEDLRTVRLDLMEPLTDGQPYFLRIVESSLTDLCGTYAVQTTIAFQAWTREVTLVLERSAVDDLRVAWPDPSFGLETAPSPSGPWTANPSLRSGSIIIPVGQAQFFRLKRLAEE